MGHFRAGKAIAVIVAAVIMLLVVWVTISSISIIGH
jgi:hypothetical protein